MTIVKPKALDKGFQTPWEAKGEEYDPEKGRAFIHYQATTMYDLSQKATQAEEALTRVTAEKDDLQKKLDDAARAGETDVERLTREINEMKQKVKDAEKPSPEVLKLEVALDKGLTKSQMKRLVGNTKEELEADADELLAEWGPNKGSDNEGGEDSNPSTQPRSGMRNPGDPNPSDSRLDFGKEADAYLSGSFGF